MVSRVGTSSSDVGTSQNMFIYVKRLANKTTHCNCSSKKGKSTKRKCMIGQRDGGDGMKTTKAHLIEKADRMEIMRVKN